MKDLLDRCWLTLRQNIKMLPRTQPVTNQAEQEHFAIKLVLGLGFQQTVKKF